MVSPIFRSLFRRSKKNKASRPLSRKPRLGVELLEAREVLSTTIAQWSFTGSTPAPNNAQNGSTGNTVSQETATTNNSTGTPALLALGMYNSYNGGNSASDDILATAGTAHSTFSESTLRVRGSTHNGWAVFNISPGTANGAPQYSQGVEMDVSTAGYSNIQVSFDWYSTTQGIRDLQVQYNTNVNNAGGWTNFVAPGGTSTATSVGNGISPAGTYIAAANDYWNGAGSAPQITVDLSGISGANNDPNFGIRLVSAFDSSHTLSPADYAGALDVYLGDLR